MPARTLTPSRLVLLLVVMAADVALAERHEEELRRYADCSAYFFMAANAKGMREFDQYYRSGEFAYNRAVRAVGKREALADFNAASKTINDLIDRQWNRFNLADDRYAVRCADIFREANTPAP